MIGIITLIEFLLGSLFHFAYDVLPYSLVAMIAPVNESIFEHLKLVLYPMLLIDIILWYRYYHQDKRILTPMQIGVVVGIMSVVLVYYFYHCGLGVDSLIADIVLLLVAILFENIMMIVSYKHHWTIDIRLWIVLVLAIIILFSIWTFYPPDLPIFIDYSK